MTGVAVAGLDQFKSKAGVYLITSPSGKQYVGSSISLRDRWLSHRRMLSRGKHHSPHLQRAFDKYGEEGLRFMVLLLCEPKHLTMYEQIAMDALRPAYNVLRHARSPLGYRHSDETKEKMAAAKRGRSLSLETRAAISIANRGRSITEEQRAKISKAHKGRTHSPEHVEKVRAANMGKIISPEAREKSRAALLGRRLSAEHADLNRTMNIGRRRSPETLKRMSDSAKKFAELNGELVLQRIRAIHLGRKRSPETRAKISAARRASIERKKAGNV